MLQGWPNYYGRSTQLTLQPHGAASRNNGRRIQYIRAQPIGPPKIPACFRLSFIELDTGTFTSGDGDLKQSFGKSNGKSRKRKRNDEEETDNSIELNAHAMKFGSDVELWLSERLEAVQREGPDMVRQLAKVEMLLDRVKTEAKRGNATTQLSAAIDEAKIYKCKYAKWQYRTNSKFNRQAGSTQTVNQKQDTS